MDTALSWIDKLLVGTSGIRLFSQVITQGYIARIGELVRVNLHDSVTITLPSALGNAGAEIIIKEVAGEEEPLSIVAGAGQSIDGAPSIRLLIGPWGAVRLMSDGAGWLIVGQSQGRYDA